MLGASRMHDLRGQQPETGVMVLGVVPGEELLAEAASVFLGTKAVRELRAVFQGGKPGVNRNPLVYASEGLRGALAPQVPHMRAAVVLGALLAAGVNLFRKKALS